MAVALGWVQSAAAADEPASDRLFEMRTYVANDGKMADLHKRFREHTNKLFVKHGMDLVGYWTPVDGPDAANTLVYILAYPNREAREKSWKAFHGRSRLAGRLQGLARRRPAGEESGNEVSQPDRLFADQVSCRLLWQLHGENTRHDRSRTLDGVSPVVPDVGDRREG